LMLLATLYQNQKELELSRRELRGSTQALRDQAVTLERQRFEGSFFSLLDQHNRILEKLLSPKFSATSGGHTGASIVAAIKNEIIGGGRQFAAKYTELEIAKRDLIRHDALLNQYFRMLYQILKFIATGSPGNNVGDDFSVDVLKRTVASSGEKFYSNIIRSFIPQDVYYLLAVNCYATDTSDAFYPYKLLIERYSLLEHMPIQMEAHENRGLVHKMADYYLPLAFDKNKEYLRYRSASASAVVGSLKPERDGTLGNS
jgi:hypothetical protein